MEKYERLLTRDTVNLQLRKEASGLTELIDLDAADALIDEIDNCGDLERIKELISDYRKNRILLRGNAQDVQLWQAGLIRKGYSLKLLNYGLKNLIFEKKRTRE